MSSVKYYACYQLSSRHNPAIRAIDSSNNIFYFILLNKFYRRIKRNTTILLIGVTSTRLNSRPVSGPIGLVNLMVAKAGGARVVITDISESRLEKAKELGADGVFHVTSRDGKQVGFVLVLV